MKASKITSPLLDQLSRLQLERNALELEVNGYTVIEAALDPDLTKRGLEATLETFKDRTGTNLTLQQEKVLTVFRFPVICCSEIPPSKAFSWLKKYWL